MADADKLLSRMNITIVSVALADPKMLADVLTRCARYHDEAKQITITVNEQDRDESCMYIMRVEYINGGEITIGALRRTPASIVEYHS